MPDPLPADPNWQDRALGLDLLKQGMGGDPGLPTADERRYGTGLLKRHMLENIGVDVERPPVYDDSPTVKEYMRRQDDPTRPNVFNLQQEIDRQYGPDAQYGVVPRARTIQLVPHEGIDPFKPVHTLEDVGDHNPFAATLIPYEGDPFGGAGASVTAPPAAAADALGSFARSVGAGIDRFTGAPARAAAPNPYPPGSEEWQFYENSRTANIEQAGPEMALAMAGGGAPAAERGALGAAGGKLDALLASEGLPPHSELVAARAAKAGLEPDPSASKYSYLPIRPFHEPLPNTPASPHFDPSKPTPPPEYSDEWFHQQLAALKEATTPKAITPKANIVDLGEKLKPFEWQAEQPQIPLNRELHPLERRAYEEVMANPERAKRAYLAGFNIDKPLFKGGYADYPETIANPAAQKTYERGLFLADKPAVAEKYGEVAPYLARAQKAHEIDWLDATGGDEMYNSSYMHKIVEAGHSKGADLLVIRGIRDLGGTQDQYVVLDPSILRAPQAKFDYDKLKHAMPLAGIAGGGAIVLDQDGDIVHYIKGPRS